VVPIHLHGLCKHKRLRLDLCQICQICQVSKLASPQLYCYCAIKSVKEVQIYVLVEQKIVHLLPTHVSTSMGMRWTGRHIWLTGTTSAFGPCCQDDSTRRNICVAWSMLWSVSFGDFHQTKFGGDWAVGTLCASLGALGEPLVCKSVTSFLS